MNEKTYLMKSTINSILDLIVATKQNGTELASFNVLCSQLKVSRTTVTEAICYLRELHIIDPKKNGKTILRMPNSSDYFDLESCKPSKEVEIEEFFLDLIMSGNLMPGDKFSELELSKKSGCTTNYCY